MGPRARYGNLRDVRGRSRTRGRTRAGQPADRRAAASVRGGTHRTARRRTDENVRGAAERELCGLAPVLQGEDAERQATEDPRHGEEHRTLLARYRHVLVGVSVNASKPLRPA
jgi:hypothetical protein